MSADKAERVQICLENPCVCSKMVGFFRNKQFCDVTFLAVKDGTRVSAHRIVLCAANENFSPLLLKMKKSTQSIENMDGAVLRQMIEFCYTGTISIDRKYLDGLMNAARRYRFDGLRNECKKYVENILCPTNCLSVAALARKNKLQSLMKTATTMAYECFVDVAQCDEFKHLDSQRLLDLLNAEDLNITSEEDVFDGIVRWVEFDLETRMQFIENLLKTVRVGHIEDLVFNDHILAWCKHHGNTTLCINLCHRKFKEVRSPRTVRRLLVLGGSESEEKKGCLTLEVYDPRLNVWKQFFTIPECRKYFSAVVVNSLLFVIGGSKMSKNICLDLKTMLLKETKPMMTERYCVATAAIDGFIYAVGGECNEAILNTVERYNVKSDKWTKVDSMSTCRAMAATTVLDGVLFVMGGRNKETKHRSVECFFPNLNKWTSMAPMTEFRVAAQACAASGFLYVFGGTGEKISSTIEKYDPKTDTWTLMTFKMEIPRRFFGMTFFQEWAYLAGGTDGITMSLSTFEKINLITGKCVILSPMLLERSYLNVLQI